MITLMHVAVIKPPTSTAITMTKGGAPSSPPPESSPTQASIKESYSDACDLLRVKGFLTTTV
jgi:hypothetical protein